MQQFSQSHLDEFSVNDVRHTLREIWRVVRARRWLFIFPTFSLMGLAFVGSLFIPRDYEGATLIRSEADPIFSIVNKSTWAQPLADVKARMIEEVRKPEMIESVLRDQGWFDRLPKLEDGRLAPEGVTRKNLMVSQVASGLSAKVISDTDNVQITKIALRHPNKKMVPAVLEGLRARYIPKAADLAVNALQDAHAFLMSEADQSREKIAALQQRLLEFEVKYPSINPEQPDVTQAEESRLIFEKIDLERDISNLKATQLELQRKLAVAESPDTPNKPTVKHTAPNPRYAGLAQEIERITAEIQQGLTIKEMTASHPEIVRLNELLAMRKAELENTPPTVAINDVPEELIKVQQTARLTEADLGSVQNQLTNTEARLAVVTGRLGEIERSRTLALEHRHLYHKTKAEIRRLESELRDWQDHIAPVAQVLYLENMNRAVRFEAMQDAWVTRTPITPKVSLVMLVCVGLGVAVGILSVVIAELIDHSYRTAKQLTTSLGIPVIESIDEIITAGASRQRILRRMVIMPMAGMLVVAGAVTAGAVAYGSLQQPEKYQQLTQSTTELFDSLVGGE